MSIFGSIFKRKFNPEQSIKEIDEMLYRLFGFGEEEEARSKAAETAFDEIGKVLEDLEKTHGKNIKKDYTELIKEMSVSLRADIRNKKFTYTMDKIEKKLEDKFTDDKYPVSFLNKVKALNKYLTEVERLVGSTFQLDKKMLVELKDIRKKYTDTLNKTIKEEEISEHDLHELLLRHLRFMLQEIVSLHQDLEKLAKDLNVKVSLRKVA